MNKLIQVAAHLKQLFKIDTYVVGGAVRDELLGKSPGDMDICLVGGVLPWNVMDALNYISGEVPGFQGFTTVHGSFPIWIVQIDDIKYEFAMARTERLTGESRTEFETKVHDVTIEEDLLRRDLTINAIAKNLLTGKIVDPYEGKFDIMYKIAKPVSTAFLEDNLRVLRAARFIATYELTPTPSLIDYCKRITPTTAIINHKLTVQLLSMERVGMEVKKLMEKAVKPSLFFDFLNQVGWLQPLFPEVYNLIGVPQSAKHHPEGDAYRHTMHTLDEATDPFIRIVMLCHDLGKATTTEVNGFPWNPPNCLAEDLLQLHKEQPLTNGLKISAHDHEKEGEILTRQMLQRIHYDSHKEIRKIECLVGLHMVRIHFVNKQRTIDKLVRRTLRRLMHYGLSYYQLVAVTWADMAGRPPIEPPTLAEVHELLHTEYALNLLINGDMNPIVTGKKLLALGISPTEEMGKIIEKALELQDRGTLTKDNWLKVLKGTSMFQSLKTISI